MTTEVLKILIKQLCAINPEKAAGLRIDNAATYKLKTFELDSLETLELAMKLEEALGLEIEIVDFSDNASLVEIADQIAEMKKN